MTTDQAEVKCPKCGADNEKDAAKCSDCGAEIKAKKRFKETQMQSLDTSMESLGKPPGISIKAKKPGER